MVDYFFILFFSYKLRIGATTENILDKFILLFMDVGNVFFMADDSDFCFQIDKRVQTSYFPVGIFHIQQHKIPNIWRISKPTNNYHIFGGDMYFILFGDIFWNSEITKNWYSRKWGFRSWTAGGSELRNDEKLIQYIYLIGSAVIYA